MAHKTKGPISLTGIFMVPWVTLAMINSPAAPKPTLMVLNHHTGISASAIFIPGQLAPQNNVTPASRKNPAAGSGWCGAPEVETWLMEVISESAVELSETCNRLKDLSHAK